MLFLIRNFLKQERGATAIEYGLIAAGISVTIMGVVFVIGDKMIVIFQSILDHLSG